MTQLLHMVPFGLLIRLHITTYGYALKVIKTRQHTTPSITATVTQLNLQEENGTRVVPDSHMSHTQRF